MSLKDIPISPKRKVQLEVILGHKVCPLTVEYFEAVKQVALLGMFNHNGPRNVYKCAVDGGLAHGGHEGTMDGRIPLSALTPCTDEYVKNCPLYKKHNGELEESAGPTNRTTINEITMENFVD